MGRRSLITLLLLLAISPGKGAVLTEFDRLTKGLPRSTEISLAYMPWMKVCDRQGIAPGNSVVCFTVKEAYLTTGQFFGSVAVIAATSSSKPKLRAVLPLGVDLARGTRMILDDSQPVSGSFSVCFSNGCLAEYQVTPDQQRKLETGKSLAVEAFDGAKGQRIFAVFPLDDFLSAANSPIPPEELQKRHDQFSDELKARSQGENANPR